jgi:hypothetical protein
MRRLAIWALACGPLVGVGACSSGGPIQATIDANVDSSWLYVGEDGAGPTLDASVTGQDAGGEPESGPVDTGAPPDTSISHPPGDASTPDSGTDAGTDAGPRDA